MDKSVLKSKRIIIKLCLIFPLIIFGFFYFWYSPRVSRNQNILETAKSIRNDKIEIKDRKSLEDKIGKPDRIYENRIEYETDQIKIIVIYDKNDQITNFMYTHQHPPDCACHENDPFLERTWYKITYSIFH